MATYELEEASKLFDKVKKDMGKDFNKAVGKPLLRRIAKGLIQTIKTRTRIGLKVLGSRDRLIDNPDIANKTKQQRYKYRKRLSQDTDPFLSNITATGQLLNSMRSKVFTRKFIIFINDKRNRSLSGGKGPDQPSNSEVLGHLEAQGRKFFGIAPSEKDELTKIIVDNIRRHIKRR